MMIQPNKISKSYSFYYCSLDEIDNREHRLCYFGPNCSYFQHDHLDLMLKRCPVSASVLMLTRYVTQSVKQIYLRILSV